MTRADLRCQRLDLSSQKTRCSEKEIWKTFLFPRAKKSNVWKAQMEVWESWLQTCQWGCELRLSKCCSSYERATAIRTVEAEHLLEGSKCQDIVAHDLRLTSFYVFRDAFNSSTPMVTSRQKTNSAFQPFSVWLCMFLEISAFWRIEWLTQVVTESSSLLTKYSRLNQVRYRPRICILRTY